MTDNLSAGRSERVSGAPNDAPASAAPTHAPSGSGRPGRPASAPPTEAPPTEAPPTDAPPTEAPPRADKRASSLVLVATGDGKGKTTAAMGTVVRAIARGWPVCVVQFLKSGQWHSGETKVLSGLGAEWHTMGDGFTWDSEDLGRSAEMTRAAWELAKEKIGSGQYRLVVLDEVTYPLNWGWIPCEEVTAFIAARPQGVNVFCTGRDAPLALIQLADTVSDVRKVKHAYEAGIMAVKGIDF